MDGPPTFVWFAEVARSLGKHVSAEGFTPPTFRAPPRTPGLTRALRRSETSVTVAVQVRARSRAEVLEDLAAGVFAAVRPTSDTDRARVGRAIARWHGEVAGDLTSGSARVAKRQTQAA